MSNRRKYCGVCESFKRYISRALARGVCYFGSFVNQTWFIYAPGGSKMNQLQCASRFSFLISPDGLIPRSLAARVWSWLLDSRADFRRSVSILSRYSTILSPGTNCGDGPSGEDGELPAVSAFLLSRLALIDFRRLGLRSSPLRSSAVWPAD